MNSKNKFIVRSILLSFIPLLIFAAIIIPIMYFFSMDTEPFIWFSELPWIIIMLPVVELSEFFYNLHRLKKLGIDINLTENQTGRLHKKSIIHLDKESLIKTLNQSAWKFKTQQIEETENGILLSMKYYKLSLNEKVEILITEQNSNSCVVTISAGAKKRYKLLGAHRFWSAAIRHLNYFEGVLENREELRLKTSLAT